MPSDKRQRQREGRLARQEELRRAQQQSKKRRQYIFGGIIVVVLFGVFYLVAQNGSSKPKTPIATDRCASTTTVATTTAGATTTASGVTSTPGATATTAVATTAPGATTAPPHAVPEIPAPANVGFPKLDGSSPHYTKFSAAPPSCIDPARTYTATIQTDAGKIVVALDQKNAPKTVNNFVFLAGYHFYDGIIFHRVIPDFMDQGGDPLGVGTGNPGYAFADELPQAGAYKAGSLAMANSGANTNGSQFFLVASAAGAAQLHPLYSLFGQVTSGQDVVAKINGDGTADGTPKVLHKIINIAIAVS